MAKYQIHIILGFYIRENLTIEDVHNLEYNLTKSLGTVQYLSEYWAGASSSKYLLAQQGEQKKKLHAQSNDNVKKLIAQHDSP